MILMIQSFNYTHVPNYCMFSINISSCFSHNITEAKEQTTGWGEMAQWVRVLATLPEDWVLFQAPI